MMSNKFVSVELEGLKFSRIFYFFLMHFLSIPPCKEVDICFLGYDISS